MVDFHQVNKLFIFYCHREYLKVTYNLRTENFLPLTIQPFEIKRFIPYNINLISINHQKCAMKLH